MDWTDEADAVLKDSIAKGLTAAQIGELLNTTRNSILGRTFRLGLSIPKKGQLRRIKPKVRIDGRKHRSKVDPLEYVDQIMDLRDMGWTWDDISKHLGLTVVKAREIAITYGGYIPKQINYFTPEEVQYLIEEWPKHTHADVIADKLGRTFGVIRQKILQLSRAGLLNVNRDPAKTRLLRQYGELALQAGETPQQALHNMAEAKKRAFAEAIQTARLNAKKRHAIAIEKMLADIDAGVERNEAIFTARSEGVSLEDIANAFGITRERVRQVCFKQAELIALRKLTGEK